MCRDFFTFFLLFCVRKNNSFFFTRKYIFTRKSHPGLTRKFFHPDPPGRFWPGPGKPGPGNPGSPGNPENFPGENFHPPGPGPGFSHPPGPGKFSGWKFSPARTRKITFSPGRPGTFRVVRVTRVATLDPTLVLAVTNRPFSKIPDHFFDGNPKLSHLYLDSNDLKSISPTLFKYNTHLKYLHLENNQVGSLTKFSQKYILYSD